ncbi:expressed unknown protein [Seminavis robusta]|uniref:Uncharacterized protein n=1 Tax=Seminavis robusta TaxID=568900 RepID=A0A9N8E0P9_9STRA|nr:expressed unknown protein [Seminavis robusta]|eukprot:Sro420_g139240.1 n/a (455) ;mRNA; r:9909-11273
MSSSPVARKSSGSAVLSPPASPGSPRGSSSPPPSPGQRRGYLVICSLLTLLTVLMPSQQTIAHTSSLVGGEIKKDVTNGNGTTSTNSSGIPGIPLPVTLQGPEDVHADQISVTSDATDATPNLRSSPEVATVDKTIAAKTQEEAEDKNTDAVIPGSISLVTSFWAQSPEEEVSPHRREIEESLLNNIHNPHIHQVVIILDGSSENANCSHFKTRMEQLEQEFNTFMNLDDNMNSPEYQARKRPLLTCVHRADTQPFYYEMFQYATNPDIVKSDIVIVANADQAFDESVATASRLKHNIVLALPTSGFDKDRVPSPTRDHFAKLHGTTAPAYANGSANRCRHKMLSWDGYAFHRTLLAGHLKPEFFQRPSVQGNAFFKMNEVGGENAALWGLQQSQRHAKYIKTCEVMHLWHFHGAPKMHAHNKKGLYWLDREGKVPKPWLVPTRFGADDTSYLY